MQDSVPALADGERMKSFMKSDTSQSSVQKFISWMKEGMQSRFEAQKKFHSAEVNKPSGEASGYEHGYAACVPPVGDAPMLRTDVCSSATFVSLQL
jgi:hypothetical protein